MWTKSTRKRNHRAERRVIKRLRRNWWGKDSRITKSQQLLLLCPFHKEEQASFIVYLAKGDYSCMGCGVTGLITDLARRHPQILARVTPEQTPQTIPDPSEVPF